MPKKVQMAKEADDEGEGPMPAWQRQKNLAEIQKLKVCYIDDRNFHFNIFYIYFISNYKLPLISNSILGWTGGWCQIQWKDDSSAFTAEANGRRSSVSCGSASGDVIYQSISIPLSAAIFN